MWIYIFGAVPIINAGFIGNKLRWGKPPKFLELKLVLNYWLNVKKVLGCKNGTDILCLRAKFGGNLK